MKREPDAELVDHYAGEMDWGFIALLLIVVLGLVFLGVGIGVWYGDARGETRGYAKGLEDQAEADRGFALQQGQAHKACVDQLLQTQEQFNQHVDQDQVQAGEQAKEPTRIDCARRRAGERVAGWELGYRQAREDWEKPCLGR